MVVVGAVKLPCHLSQPLQLRSLPPKNVILTAISSTLRLKLATLVTAGFPTMEEMPFFSFSNSSHAAFLSSSVKFSSTYTKDEKYCYYCHCIENKNLELSVGDLKFADSFARYKHDLKSECPSIRMSVFTLYPISSVKDQGSV